jgi:hypothetical protein
MMHSKQRLSSALERPPLGPGLTFGGCRETLPLFVGQASPGHQSPPCDQRGWSYAVTPYGVLK